MPKLPSGIFRRAGRRGFYIRVYRDGTDRAIKAGDTVEEARTFKDRAKGSGVQPGRLTVKDAAKRWLSSALPLTRNPRGVTLARQRVENDLLPHLGARRLSLLSREDCRKYRMDLESRKPTRSPQTVAHILADLRAMLLWAVDAGLLDRSPFPRRILPRVKEKAPDRLTDEEALELVALPEPWGFYLRLLLGTGIRWGEAVRAEAQHIERGHLVLSQTKSGRVRRVPLSPELEREIKGRVGKLLHIVKAEALAKHGQEVVPRFHVHMTRHTFACRWLEAGGSVTALQEVLGHASVTTTQRYGRPSEESIRREGAKSWG